MTSPEYIVNEIIKVGKVYKDQDGEDVRIICVDRVHTYPVLGLFIRYKDGFEYCRQYTSEGVAGVNTTSNLVLLTKGVDWSKVPVDTVVYEHNFPGVNYHFSRYESGRVYSFEQGRSSKTTRFPTAQHHNALINARVYGLT